MATINRRLELPLAARPDVSSSNEHLLDEEESSAIRPSSGSPANNGFLEAVPDSDRKDKLMDNLAHVIFTSGTTGTPKGMDKAPSEYGE